MVLPSPGGSAGVYGYSMQPACEGRSGLLFPLDDGILKEYKMDSYVLILIFRWLIHISTLVDP
jgi:hypothetical protein